MAMRWPCCHLWRAAKRPDGRTVGRSDGKGMTHLTRTPISIDMLVREVAGPERGGTCVFLGTVRDAPRDGGVTGIEYSGYDAMADAELERILAEAAKRWPESRIAVR